LAEQHPASIASWLLGRPVKQARLLKTELPSESVRPDFLCLIDVGDEILHAEFQTRVDSDPPLGFRLLEYAARLYRLHRRPVEQFVVLLKPTQRRLAEVFRFSHTVHCFRVVRLWEQPAAPLLANLDLVPLAVLARGASPTQLQAVARRLAQTSSQPDHGDRVNYARILAGLVFDKNTIHRLLRLSVMKESVIYQEILEEGRTEGRAEGQQAALREDVAEVLRVRFKRVPDDVERHLAEVADLTQLKQFLRLALRAKSLDSFMRHLA
jgi:predicted transposase YdaD